MLFGKYHIVIFKNHGKGGTRNLYLRGWLGLAAVCLIVGLVACNIWLWQQYATSRHLQQELTKSEKNLEEQRGQVMSLSSKINILSTDLQRIQQFDAKLRIMMNMEQEPAETGGIGGARGADFSTTYAALHRQELVARKLQVFLKHLTEEAQLEEVRQQELLLALRDNRDRLQAMPSIWPVEGMVSSRFGGRASPFGGRREFHKGLDIRGRTGTPIIAPAFGIVIMTGYDGAYGNSVVIDHGNGVITKYAHLHRFSVKKGQSIKRGEILGYVGSTGRSTGPHLHYEVRLNGMNVDPMRYILN